MKARDQQLSGLYFSCSDDEPPAYRMNELKRYDTDVNITLSDKEVLYIKGRSTTIA